MALKDHDKSTPFDYGETRSDGQYENYPVLPAEALGNRLRNVRRSYKHLKCGTVTTMGRLLAETYAVDPSYYSHTYCVGCKTHPPVSEFVWEGTDIPVGS